MNIRSIDRKHKKRKYLNKNINIKIVSIFLCIIFLIGTIGGSLYFNNILESELVENENNIFIFNSVESFKEKNEIFKQSITQNILILFAFWVLGLSILGIPLLIFIVFFEGFSIGITTSYILVNLGFYIGYTFIYLCMYINTVLNMIAILLLSVSSFKVTSNVFQNIRSVKNEVIRHSTTCFCVLIILIFSSFIETNMAEIGKNLLF